MAAVKGVNITNLDATPVVLPKASNVHGRIRAWYDTYEASALAAASTITLARLPAGAKVLNVTVWHDDLGTSAGTLEVGDAADPNRFLTAFATGAAGAQDMKGANADINGVGFDYTTETDIVVTTAGAAVTGTIKMLVEYTVD